MKQKNRPSILIVDDNSKNLQILANMLRTRNYQVAIAKDGFNALKFAFKMMPDLILLDIMMAHTNSLSKNGVFCKTAFQAVSAS